MQQNVDLTLMRWAIEMGNSFDIAVVTLISIDNHAPGSPLCSLGSKLGSGLLAGQGHAEGVKALHG